MKWTAPEVARPGPLWLADERPALLSRLDHHRATLLAKCSGLTAEQLRRRAVPPSEISLLGLVRHMSDVERQWFRRRVAGEALDQLYWKGPDPDDDFLAVDDADPEADFATFAAEVEAARRAIDGRPLDETYVDSRSDGDVRFDLRSVVIHMIEEYARHNGHADILREQIDGATGQ
ncbi:DinB family protein [Angustibacter sp. McL0619]|uniref:DinB family protein n=1 Tax=Angustibacter sp. McL0619 TaxID=3415676 RepID=UPI003CF3AD76